MQILIAEDDFASRILLEAVLVKWGYGVTTADDGEAAWDVLREDNAPAIAIVDWMMPKLSGVELCRRVREQHRELVPYILMLTAKGQKADVTFGLDAGADDYLVKPFDLSELGARMRVAKRSIGLQRELIEARKAAHYQAVHDVSTGALNRGSALSQLSEMLGSATPLSIALAAVGNHKQLQERDGAQAAEAVVRAVVQRWRALAPTAMLGRYGPSELLVTLPSGAAADLAELAAQVRADVGTNAFRMSSGVRSPVAFAAGVAEWDGSASLELLLCYADTALYAAQPGGVEIFDLKVSAG